MLIANPLSHQNRAARLSSAPGYDAVVTDEPPDLVSRIFACWRGKALMFLLLVPLFNLFYFLPQWVGWHAPARLPMTAIDLAVPFDAGWVYAYVSMYVMLLIPPLLTTRGGALWRYTVGAAIMFVAAAVVFLLWPVEYPRPALPADGSSMYRVVVTLDRPINSIPSLHAGIVGYTLFYAARALADLPRAARRWILIVGAVWSAFILYGTLATKQHYFVDLPPGILLAWVAHRIAWSGTPRSPRLDEPEPAPALAASSS